MARNALRLITALAGLHCSLRCNAYYARGLTAADDDIACVNNAWAAYKESMHSLRSDAWKVALRSLLRPHATGTHARSVMASTDVLAAIAACDHHINLTCTMVRLTGSPLETIIIKMISYKHNTPVYAEACQPRQKTVLVLRMQRFHKSLPKGYSLQQH